MRIRLPLSLCCLLASLTPSIGQDFHQVIFGDPDVWVAKDHTVPKDEVWLLSALDQNCTVLLTTGFDATVSITRKEDANDPSMVFICFVPKNLDVSKATGFYAKLPIVLKQETRLSYRTEAGEKIIFLATQP